MTRLDKISPLWEICDGLFLIWENAEPTRQICDIIGLIFIAANEQILKNNLTIWSLWPQLMPKLIARFWCTEIVSMGRCCAWAWTQVARDEARSSLVEGDEGSYLPNCKRNLVIALLVLSLFLTFHKCISLQLRWYKLSSPVSCYAPRMDGRHRRNAQFWCVVKSFHFHDELALP